MDVVDGERVFNGEKTRLGNSLRKRVFVHVHRFINRFTIMGQKSQRLWIETILVWSKTEKDKIAIYSFTVPRVSGASKRANGRASGPVLYSWLFWPKVYFSVFQSFIPLSVNANFAIFKINKLF